MVLVKNINEAIIKTQAVNKLLSEKIRSPEHCLRLERWQGLPHINKVKQYEIVLLRSVCFYSD